MSRVHKLMPSLLALLSVSCQGSKAERATHFVAGGDAQHGRSAAYDRGCGACHTIPGVRGAYGTVAQSLAGFSQRTFIAGELPNTPDNLERWIMDPPSIQPKTAMPNLGVGAAEARDIAAFLYSVD